MKIIIVTPNYPPSIGGVQNCTKEISEGLAKKGHEIVVFTCRNGINIKTQIKENLTVYYLKNFVFAHTPIVPMLFFKLLLIPKDSIIDLHISKAFVPEMVYLVSKIRRVPYVAHFHLDVGPSGLFGFLLPFYKKFILVRVLRSAKFVIVLSDQYKSLMKQKYLLSRNVVVISNGVGEEFFVQRTGRENKKSFNLLYVGRISVQKRVDRLVEAAALLGNKVRLDIVGEGELMPQIKKMIKDLKLNNVIIHGSKVGYELVDFYRKADIFVLASSQEGLPLVLLEAMAVGIPVIASDVVGNHEFAGDTGILVNPPTPENFAREIDRLIKNKNLAYKLSLRGKKKAKDYSWDNIVKKFEDIYKEVSENK